MQQRYVCVRVQYLLHRVAPPAPACVRLRVGAEVGVEAEADVPPAEEGGEGGGGGAGNLLVPIDSVDML